MKEKQFDHIANKIREAAENSEPDFDEQSWQKMELLLDKDNDRKRPVGWLWLPLIVAALVGGYFIFNAVNTDKKSAPIENNMATVEKKESTEKNLQSKNPGQSQGTNTSGTDAIITSQQTSGTVSGTANFVSNTLFRSATAGAKSKDDIFNSAANGDYFHKNKLKGKGKQKMTITNGDAVSDDADGKEIADVNDQKNNPQTISPAATTNEVTGAENKKSTVAIANQKDTLSEKKKEPAVVKTTDKKNKDKKSSRFYFLGTIGGEASSVKFLSLHNSAVVAKYGLGVGYQLSDKFSVQTGFSVSRKKYIAGPDDYNPKTGSYWAMVQIKKVDANCLVYEIPLAFRYNILQQKNTKLYATAGVSSFIMKKEDYVYWYKRDNQDHVGSWTYKGNKNLFSVASVSAGVEQKLNSRFSLLVEPSVSVPLTGVGDGRVKLFSMGMQAGIKFNPMKKKK